MVVRRCCRAGDRQGAVVVKDEMHAGGVEAGRPVREGLLLKGEEPCPQTDTGLVLSSLPPPPLPLSLQQSTPDRQSYGIQPSLERRSWCA